MTLSAARQISVGDAVVSSRSFAGTARIGAAALGLMLIAGGSFAQPAEKPPTPAAGDAAALEKGRDLFTNYGCGSCHSLGDAGATGHVGPGLDGNASLTQDFVVGRIANGQGMMPSFSGQLSAEEISALAAYIMKVKTN